MKKHILIAFLSTSAFIVTPFSARADSRAAMGSSAQQVASKSVESLPVDFIGHIENLATLLDECDQGNADETAQKVNQLTEELEVTMVNLSRMRRTDPQALQRAFRNNSAAFAQALNHMTQSGAKIDAVNCYGSAALEEAMFKFAATMRAFM